MKAIKKEILLCPNCKKVGLLFTQSSNRIVCGNCNKEYVFKNEKFYFSDYTESDVSDFLDNIKFKLKKYQKFYGLLISIISPVCPTNNGIKRFIKKYVANKDVLALNLGSGNNDLHENISNVDIFNYDNVDITADLLNLPIQNETIDVIMNIAVLEHIPFPDKAVDEFNRILKKGGIVYCFFPFMQGFHASPYDFSRRTIEGLKELFKNFEILEIRDAQGPTSGFLWVFQEYVAILFSFGIKPLYLLLYVLIMVLTFPLKFLDILFVKHPMGKNISSGFYVIAKKKDC